MTLYEQKALRAIDDKDNARALVFATLAVAVALAEQTKVSLPPEEKKAIPKV